MGIFDFVRQGTADALVARPSSSRGPIHVHEGGPLPLYGQLEVGADECAVFVRDGRAIGIVGPGHHGLAPAKLPFLEGAVDAAGAAGTIDARLVFVRLVPIERASVRAVVEQLEPASFDGALRIEVVDPAALVEDWLVAPERPLIARPGVVASLDGARLVVEGRRIAVFAGARLPTHASVAPAPRASESATPARCACRACGTEGDVGSFCEGCGALVDALARCVSCRAELRAGARFCAACGVRVG